MTPPPVTGARTDGSSGTRLGRVGATGSVTTGGGVGSVGGSVVGVVVAVGDAVVVVVQGRSTKNVSLSPRCTGSPAAGTAVITQGPGAVGGSAAAATCVTGVRHTVPSPHFSLIRSLM